ncbi:MAG TPA: hypothetical protein VH333_12285 [Pseudonocardiaceae bacterium]|jgi:Mce-associated membrane protein|nr:hypothetical protein [Pseudonocardiaceae bacterium]
MPPTRRRPLPTPTPARRPRVAGLRHPEAPPRPASDEPPVDDTPTQIIPAITDEPAVPAPNGAPAPNGTPKSRPAGKAKQTWTEPAAAKPAAKPRPEAAVSDEMPAIDVVLDESEPRRRGWVLPVALAVVAVLLGGVASWLGVQWAHARDQVQNTALVDAAGTSEVSGQVVSAVSTIFSYNYTNMQKTETAVQRLLTGTALCQYDLLYKVVKQQAPTQKLVLTTTVQAKGVEMLQGGTARVLLLLQQTDTRASTNQTSTSQSMIAVNAVHNNGTWQISAIDTLNGDNATASCK